MRIGLSTEEEKVRDTATIWKYQIWSDREKNAIWQPCLFGSQLSLSVASVYKYSSLVVCCWQNNGGRCLPCECDGRASTCDHVTGQCIDCANNTAGFNCKDCAPRYYRTVDAGCQRKYNVNSAVQGIIRRKVSNSWKWLSSHYWSLGIVLFNTAHTTSY